MAEYFICAQTGLRRDATVERTSYEGRARAIRLAANYCKQANIDRICARHQLESDEFQTAEQKARALMSFE